MKRLLRKLFGFTLTELMAVVIIVAILAAMSAGSFKQAIERSHFNEGLQASANVAASVDRFYYENLTAASKYPKISDLDVELSKAGACATPSDYCAKTRYFEVEITKDSDNGTVVQAYRTKGGVRSDFSIRYYPEFRSSHQALEECIYTTTAGKNLCMSVGYYSCEDSVCNREYGYYNTK